VGRVVIRTFSQPVVRAVVTVCPGLLHTFVSLSRVSFIVDTSAAPLGCRGVNRSSWFLLSTQSRPLLWAIYGHGVAAADGPAAAQTIGRVHNLLATARDTPDHPALKRRHVINDDLGNIACLAHRGYLWLTHGLVVLSP
jgi:hypothetical protein